MMGNEVSVEQVNDINRSGLPNYSGNWTPVQARHLLRRTTFGATKAEIDQAVQLGMEASVEQLLADRALPTPPINYNFEDDPDVPIGDTWVNSPHSEGVISYRRTSIKAWTMENILEEGLSAREKMVLFWHNHFPIAQTLDPRYEYSYSTTLRENAFGNFRELVKLITIDPAMLRYLNGNRNTKQAPNENYARELLELFTIGKGPIAGPGDYTHYTEHDVREISKILTGWVDRGFYGAPPVQVLFRPVRHDASTKQLSDRFGGVIIENKGSEEYAYLIDIIFQQTEVARFICRKLYQWFVYYEIDDTIEADVIEPMAQMLIAEQYDIKPVLFSLWTSAHFYDSDHLGCMIRHPIDFIPGLFRTAGCTIPDELNARLRLLQGLFNSCTILGMQYYEIPQVAGWKAFYSSPAYYQLWINSVSLPLRKLYVDLLTLVDEGLVGQVIQFDGLAMLATLDNPYNVNNVVSEIAELFLSRPLTSSQHTALKTVLLPGLPDYEWTAEYSNYIADPDDEDLAESINNRMKAYLNTLLNLPEAHLS